MGPSLAEKGGQLSPGLCLLGVQLSGKQTPPVLHSIVQMQKVPLHPPLGDDIGPRLSHNVTDKEAEACGDGVFFVSRSVAEREVPPQAF